MFAIDHTDKHIVHSTGNITICTFETIGHETTYFEIIMYITFQSIFSVQEVLVKGPQSKIIFKKSDFFVTPYWISKVTLIIN